MLSVGNNEDMQCRWEEEGGVWPTMAEEGEGAGWRREVWLRMILRASAIINIELRSGDLVLSDWPNVTRSITRWCHNDALILVGGEGVLVGGYFVLPASPVNTTHLQPAVSISIPYMKNTSTLKKSKWIFDEG